MTTTAIIRDDSPRAANWRRTFGGGEVPILSPIPTLTRLPDRIAEVYLVDVAQLSPEQIERVVADITSRFGVSADQVRRDLADPEHGLPLLAEDVTVVSTGRDFL